MPSGNLNEDAPGVVIPFPGRPPKPAPSLALIARQASDYLAELRPLLDRPEVRRGLFRTVRLLNPKTSTGAAIRQLVILSARALEEEDAETVSDWIRARIIAAQQEVIAGLKSGAVRPLSGDYEQYRTAKESEGDHGRQ
jgi:hypothetical protein